MNNISDTTHKRRNFDKIKNFLDHAFFDWEMLIECSPTWRRRAATFLTHFNVAGVAYTIGVFNFPVYTVRILIAYAGKKNILPFIINPKIVVLKKP